jgi:hypothetical protein
MCGSIRPLPNMPSWRDAQLKKAQGQLYLLYIISVQQCHGNCKGDIHAAVREICPSNITASQSQ